MPDPSPLPPLPVPTPGVPWYKDRAFLAALFLMLASLINGWQANDTGSKASDVRAEVKELRKEVREIKDSHRPLVYGKE